MTLRIALCAFAAGAAGGQSKLPVKGDELLATDFPAAIQKAQGTCVQRFGVPEKHAPHLPIGTDVIDSRCASRRAATAYNARMQLDLLKETTTEMALNGGRKIAIVAQFDQPRDHVVCVCNGGSVSGGPERPGTPPGADGHAGVPETPRLMVTRPDPVHMERVPMQPGADRKREDLPKGVFTGTPRLPNEFYEKAKRPLETKQ